MLKNKKCLPCEGGVEPLNLEKSQELLEELEGWFLQDNKYIEKVFSFKNFKGALAFVNKIGVLAENESHHPDICIFNWNEVRVTVTTYTIKGLSENDFILATKIDSLL